MGWWPANKSGIEWVGSQWTRLEEILDYVPLLAVRIFRILPAELYSWSYRWSMIIPDLTMVAFLFDTIWCIDNALHISQLLKDHQPTKASIFCLTMYFYVFSMFGMLHWSQHYPQSSIKSFNIPFMSSFSLLYHSLPFLKVAEKQSCYYSVSI